MNISDIAQKTGLTPKAIRFYEDKSFDHATGTG